MPTDDYSVAISGGLKLKGVNDSSKVSKPQKKKRSKLASTNTKFEGSKDEAPEFSKEADVEEYAHDGDLNVNLNRRKMDDVEKDALSRPQVGRTEAELKHEERKRKRLDERLKREGTKTHKERVEELNRYLSNLSEHHDMPRIGPG